MAKKETNLAVIERRAKRAARREKQRGLNSVRAQKMHEAWLGSKVVSQAQELEPPRINVGCSGWFYWHWKGKFYPEGMPTKSWFEHYATHFNTVELNASFYAWPTIGTVKTWGKQVGNRPFVYTVKVCELITHIKRFCGTKTLVKDFGHVSDLLGSLMGCFLFQLPPSFHYTPARLKNILGQLDHTRRNVVEFRHSSWWNENVYQAFHTSGTIFCSCSGPRLPDVLIKTAEDVYIRFHGIEQWYRYDYSLDELMVWVERIRKSGAKRVWAYFNNDFEAQAVSNAMNFEKLLRENI